MPTLGNDEFIWDEQNALAFAAYAVKERIQWAAITDASAAPVPFDILQKRFVEKRLPKQQSNKDWEILSFKDSDWEYKLIEDWQNIPCYSQAHYEAPGRMMSLGYALETKSEIHSVKRLSDEEVFTVGDEVNNPNYASWKIGSFKIEGGVLIVCTESDFDCPSFAKLQKAKQSLFKTEDGVDIYEGDTYWYVVTSDSPALIKANRTWHPFPQIAERGEGEFGKCPLGAVQFSTEQAAKDYILNHKPCLSLTDVLAASGIWLKYPDIKEQLTNLAQSKIIKP